MFGDSDLSNLGTRSLLFPNFLTHMNSDSALAMDRRCNLRFSFCGLCHTFQRRVGLGEFIPLDTWGSYKIGVGVDNVQEILRHDMFKWLRWFDLIIMVRSENAEMKG